jgi:hypothetical protein
MACCEEITMNDVLFQNYWDKIYPMLSDLMCNAENYEVFGNQDGATESYDMMNDLWYMFVYGQIAFYEQQLKLKNIYPETATDCPDKLPTMKEIWDQFGFECMTEYFKCNHGIDMKGILSSVFGLGTSIGKGIDYMRIENNDDCIPPFKIV